MSKPQQKSKFEFFGGHLALDFANTLENPESDHPDNLLKSYDDLLQWGQEGKGMPAKSIARLRFLAAETPGKAQAALREAVQLRDALYSIFSAVAGRRGIPDVALGCLNRSLHRTAEHARLVYDARRFVWEWIDPDENFDSILWPVARAAADLLTSEDAVLVGQCASTSCSAVFLDKTKNHRRRWCDMRICGNRDKARRYYRRMNR
jgi:predicted RNA-binding Zn ribbon-like protein